MKLLQIKNEAEVLCTLNDDCAYLKGLQLLRELKQYRKSISRKTYKQIENMIQEQRFRN